MSAKSGLFGLTAGSLYSILRVKRHLVSTSSPSAVRLFAFRVVLTGLTAAAAHHATEQWTDFRKRTKDSGLERLKEDEGFLRIELVNKPSAELAALFFGGKGSVAEREERANKAALSVMTPIETSELGDGSTEAELDQLHAELLQELEMRDKRRQNEESVRGRLKNFFKKL